MSPSVCAPSLNSSAEPEVFVAKQESQVLDLKKVDIGANRDEKSTTETDGAFLHTIPGRGNEHTNSRNLATPKSHLVRQQFAEQDVGEDDGEANSLSTSRFSISPKSSDDVDTVEKGDPMYENRAEDNEDDNALRSGKVQFGYFENRGMIELDGPLNGNSVVLKQESGLAEDGGAGDGCKIKASAFVPVVPVGNWLVPSTGNGNFGMNKTTPLEKREAAQNKRARRFMKEERKCFRNGIIQVGDCQRQPKTLRETDRQG